MCVISARAGSSKALEDGDWTSKSDLGDVMASVMIYVGKYAKVSGGRGYKMNPLGAGIKSIVQLGLQTTLLSSKS